MGNCLLTYNNSARGLGGALRASLQSKVDLVHCSVVGSFSPQKRSGLYLDAGATVDIKDSILWHNAGGSVESNGATVNIANTLNEDACNSAKGGLCCVPKYVGWGNLDTVYVDALAKGPGTGTAADPYPDLQLALNGFDFGLAADSCCVGTASDSRNMGADTGVRGTAGNTIALLHVMDGPSPLEIRGRNLMFVREVQAMRTAVISHAVFAGVKDTLFSGVTITGEEIFGGVTVRADANFVGCQVNRNIALADGGGVYVADGNCVMTADTYVSGNACSGNGGGVFLCPGTKLGLLSSHLEHNKATNGGGGFASDMTTTTATDSTVIDNNCPGNGGGLYLGPKSVSRIKLSRLAENEAGRGGAIHVSGQMTLSVCELSSNDADRSPFYGGAVYVFDDANVDIADCNVLSNHANDTAGGIHCYGKARISNCRFQGNTAAWGAAIQVQGRSSLLFCETSRFITNTATRNGGALRCLNNTAPVFVDCNFVGNKADQGGAAICTPGSHVAFDDCSFIGNKANQGGSLYLHSSATLVTDCSFTGDSSILASEGGMAYLYEADTSLFKDCTPWDHPQVPTEAHSTSPVHPSPCSLGFTSPIARLRNHGGGVAVFEAAKPSFREVTVSDCQAGLFGGGVYGSGTSDSTFDGCEFRRDKTTGASADGGGAYFADHAIAWLVRCRFQENKAEDDGGGMGAANFAKVDLPQYPLLPQHGPKHRRLCSPHVRL